MYDKQLINELASAADQLPGNVTAVIVFFFAGV